MSPVLEPPWRIVVAAGVAGTAAGAVASHGSGWNRVGTAVVIGLITAFSTAKLTSASPVSVSKEFQFGWFLVAAIAVFDGIATLADGSAFADWSLGAWSLPLGLFVLATSVVDFRRWRRMNATDAGPTPPLGGGPDSGGGAPGSSGPPRDRRA